MTLDEARAALGSGRDPAAVWRELVAGHGHEEASRMWLELYAAQDASAQTG